MQVTSSSGHWMIVELELPSDASQALPSTPDAAAVPLLEFVVTNGAGEWDKPATGACTTGHWGSAFLFLTLDLPRCQNALLSAVHMFCPMAVAPNDLTDDLPDPI